MLYKCYISFCTRLTHLKQLTFCNTTSCNVFARLLKYTFRFTALKFWGDALYSYDMQLDKHVRNSWWCMHKKSTSEIGLTDSGRAWFMLQYRYCQFTMNFLAALS